jgi:hypothetical protein
MAVSSRPVRRASLAAVLSLAGLAAGCGGDESVRAYKVPRSTERDKAGPVGAPAEGGEYRILGAAYPADDPVWYFKLTGTADDLAKYEAAFDKLLASVKLQGDAVPAFTLPDGWTRGGPRDVSRGGVTVRFEETIKFGPPDQPLEVTISKAGGGLRSNVGRWANQVGYPAPFNVPAYTKEFQADGVKGVRVDVKGPSNPSGGMRPPMGGGR